MSIPELKTENTPIVPRNVPATTQNSDLTRRISAFSCLVISASLSIGGGIGLGSCQSNECSIISGTALGIGIIGLVVSARMRKNCICFH